METKLQAIGTLEREGIVKQAVKSLGYRLKMNRRRPCFMMLDFISGKDVFIALPTGFGKTLSRQSLYADSRRRETNSTYISESQI